MTEQPPRPSVALRRLVVVLLLVAGGVSLAALAVTGVHPTLMGIGIMIAGTAGAEALKVELSFRRAGNVAFGLSEAVLTAGLLLFSPSDVVLGVVVGLVLWQVYERLPAIKFGANLGQFVAGTGAAAIALHLIAGTSSGLEGRTLVGVVVAITLFFVVNLVTIGALIGTTSNQSWVAVYRRLAPTGSLSAAASACLGLLAVVVADAHPWSLPVLAVPVVVLHWGARLDVKAREERERSAAFVAVEHQLRDAADADEVAIRLAEGVRDILGCQAAVWRGGRWATPVPAGSGPCPVDSDLHVTLTARGPALGPAVGGLCAAIGLGDGVLVAWAGDAAISAHSEEWLERLGRSGRVHLDRAKAHASLERERATLRAVVDGTGDGILVLDHDGIVRLWNPAMAALSGVTAEQAIGRPVVSVLGDGPWTSEGVHDVVHDGERVWRVSLAAVRDQRVFFGPQPRSDLLVAVVHDITAERRAARMKDDMLAVVSHELRTPLTPIKASAQLLNRRWDRLAAPQRTELLGQIESRADHLARLVEDLLLVGQLSSSHNARPPVRPVEVDLSTFAAECTAQLAAAHPLHDIDLHCPPGLAVRTDPVRIRQILDNLVGNACKFSPAGSPVQVTIHDDRPSGLRLVVADQGRGIPAGDLQRVFERFERVEDPLHMTTSGAGLGLYIVRALARALGGDVAIHSSLGEGTTVTVVMDVEQTSRTTDDSAGIQTG